MRKSQVKAMTIVFFDIIIMIEWLPEGLTINQKYYLEVLTKLLRTSKKKEAGIMEQEIMDSASRQYASSQCPLREALFACECITTGPPL
jgi:hypothetical protein